jgi:hypothetical protein
MLKASFSRNVKETSELYGIFGMTQARGIKMKL